MECDFDFEIKGIFKLRDITSVVVVILKRYEYKSINTNVFVLKKKKIISSFSIIIIQERKRATSGTSYKTTISHYMATTSTSLTVHLVAPNTCSGHFEWLSPKLTRRKKSRESFPDVTATKYSDPARVQSWKAFALISPPPLPAGRTKYFTTATAASSLMKCPRWLMADGESRLDLIRELKLPGIRKDALSLLSLSLSLSLRYRSHTLTGMKLTNIAVPCVQRIYFAHIDSIHKPATYTMISRYDVYIGSTSIYRAIRIFRCQLIDRLISSYIRKQHEAW